MGRMSTLEGCGATKANQCHTGLTIFSDEQTMKVSPLSTKWWPSRWQLKPLHKVEDLSTTQLEAPNSTEKLCNTKHNLQGRNLPSRTWRHPRQTRSTRDYRRIKLPSLGERKSWELHIREEIPILYSFPKCYCCFMPWVVLSLGEAALPLNLTKVNLTNNTSLCRTMGSCTTVFEGGSIVYLKFPCNWRYYRDIFGPVTLGLQSVGTNQMVLAE
jgi:hypothetical protein